MNGLGSRHNVLKVTLSICWVLTAVIGFNGFFKNHDLLTIGVAGFKLTASVVVLSAFIMFAAAIAAVFVQRGYNKLLFFLSVAAYLLLCLGDVHRLAPYILVFYTLFALFIFLKTNESLFYQCLLFILSGLYIFSGLHKYNLNFVKTVAPLFYIHALPINYSVTIGYGMATVEVVLGILLFFKPTRTISSCLLIFMHMLILWKLSPWQYGYNYIIVPWNILMILSNLFLMTHVHKARTVVNVGHPCMIAVLLLFWLLPGLSQFNKIPENLSFKLYSGNTQNGYVSFREKISAFKSIDLQPNERTMLISLQQLSMQKRGIAFNPEKKYFKIVFERFRESYPSTNKLHFEKLDAILKTPLGSHSINK